MSALRVYVREPEQLAAVRAVFDASGIPDENIVYLHGEICRRELAVELEGVFSDLKMRIASVIVRKKSALYIRRTEAQTFIKMRQHSGEGFKMENSQSTLWFKLAVSLSIDRHRSWFAHGQVGKPFDVSGARTHQSARLGFDGTVRFDLPAVPVDGC